MLGGAALPSALGLSLGWTVTFSGVGGRGDGGATPNTLSVESTTWGKGTFSPVISAYPTNATIAAERPADDSRVRVLGSATAITRMWARSEERRVGNGWLRTWRTRGAALH